MEQELLIALLAGFGSMLGWGFADFFAKKTIDRIGDITTLFWGQLLGVVPLLILFFFNPVIPKLGGGGVVFLIFLGIWSGLSYIPTYIAFGKGKVSLLSPIFAAYAVVVTILSAVFFKEIIPFGRQLAFVVVFAGILLINGNPKNLWLLATGKARENKEKIAGLKEILFAVCIYSLWIIALDRFVNGQYWVPFLLVIRIFSSISLYTYAKARGVRLAVPDKSLWKFLVFIGLFDVAAFSFLSFGLSATSYTSIVAMLGGVFSLPTILLARIFLKERVTRLQSIGSIVVILGIILLSLL